MYWMHRKGISLKSMDANKVPLKPRRGMNTRAVTAAGEKLEREKKALSGPEQVFVQEPDEDFQVFCQRAGRKRPPEIPWDPEFTVTRLPSLYPHGKFPLEMQAEIIKYMELNQRGTTGWTGHIPSDLARVSKFWAREIQPLYYDHVFLNVGEALSLLKRWNKEEEYCISFFRAALHPVIKDIPSPLIHLHTLVIKHNKFTDIWWASFVEAIPLMTRLQRLCLVYEFRETFFGRVSELGDLFPPTLSSLALSMTLDEQFQEEEVPRPAKIWSDSAAFPNLINRWPSVKNIYLKIPTFCFWQPTKEHFANEVSRWTDDIPEDHSLRRIDIECGTSRSSINNRLNASSLWHEQKEGVNGFFMPQLQDQESLAFNTPRLGYAVWRDDIGWHGGKGENFSLRWSYAGVDRFQKVPYF